MKRLTHYVGTSDADGRSAVLKVNVIGERGQWRMLHVCGERYRDEAEFVLHERFVTRSWMSAWMRAKRVSRTRRGFRARCAERVIVSPA